MVTVNLPQKYAVDPYQTLTNMFLHALAKRTYHTNAKDLVLIYNFLIAERRLSYLNNLCINDNFIRG